MSSKSFHLGDLLSVTTGILLSPRHIDGVYDILDYMTGDELYTTQLPRAAEECKPYLLDQHPFLATLVLPEINTDNWKQVLDNLVIEYGETFEVAPIPAEDHMHLNPVEEFVYQKALGKTVITPEDVLNNPEPELPDDVSIIVVSPEDEDTAGRIDWKVDDGEE